MKIKKKIFFSWGGGWVRGGGVGWGSQGGWERRSDSGGGGGVGLGGVGVDVNGAVKLL